MLELTSSLSDVEDCTNEVEEISGSFDRLDHLVRALRSTSDPNEVLVVPLTFYGDASWNQADVGPPVMVASGFLTSEKLWGDFEKKWTAMLKHFGVRYFRMAEFAHRKGQFKGWEDRESDRKEFIRRAVAIISEFAWASFGAGLLTDDWELCNRQYLFKEEGFYPYPLCSWTCIDQVRLWCLGRNRLRKQYPFKDVVFFFERGDPNQGHLDKLAYRDFDKVLHFEDKIPKDGAPPIGAFQAADFAAWHVRNVIGNFEAGNLERFRVDFELLFSRVEWKDHHADFSMKLPSERPQNRLYTITNDDPLLSDQPSLVRFCEDYYHRKIPRRA
jgi:hypothetical protein